MNKVQVMENMIRKYEDSIERLKPDLEGQDDDKKIRARDAIEYAEKQIAEGKRIIEKENNRKCCQDCKNCGKSQSH